MPTGHRCWNKGLRDGVILFNNKRALSVWAGSGASERMIIICGARTNSF